MTQSFLPLEHPTQYSFFTFLLLASLTFPTFWKADLHFTHVNIFTVSHYQQLRSLAGFSAVQIAH